MVLGLVGTIAFASGSTAKAFGMVLLGMMSGLVGTDVTSAAVRYAFGYQFLSDGIDFVIVAMGLGDFPCYDTADARVHDAAGRLSMAKDALEGVSAKKGL